MVLLDKMLGHLRRWQTILTLQPHVEARPGALDAGPVGTVEQIQGREGAGTDHTHLLTGLTAS